MIEKTPAPAKVPLPAAPPAPPVDEAKRRFACGAKFANLTQLTHPPSKQ